MLLSQQEEGLLNRRVTQGSKLAALTSMQALLQELNTRVRTLETDLKAVKYVIKAVKRVTNYWNTTIILYKIYS